jgi:ribosomal protein S27AE
MAKKYAASRRMFYTIDLTKIDGDGSFRCPKCGTVISPEDETETIYKIVNTKVINDELVELTVVCGNCGSNIKLTGFQQTINGLANE